MRRDLSAAIGRAKKAGEDASHLIARHREIGRRIEQLRPNTPAANADGQPLTTELISDVGRFANMREEWRELARHGHCCSPFLLWEWLYPWWETYGDGRELALVTCRHGGKLVGIAPLMWGVRRGRTIDRRTLGFIGTGERALGDYFGLILARGHEDQVRLALLEEVSGVLHDGLTAELTLMAADGDMARLVEALAGRGLEAIVRPRRNSVLVTLPGSFEEFVESVPSPRRRSYLRNQDEALRGRFSSIEYTSARTEAEMLELIAALSGFSRERLTGDGTASAWEEESFCRCMLRICAAFLECGGLRLEGLRLDGAVAAVLMGFVHGGTYFLYQISFDPGFAEFRPGHCLIGHRIRESIREGLTSFDFLAGEHGYKTTYSDGRKRLADVTVFWPTPRSLWRTGLGYIAEACRTKAKSVLGRT